ncbi:hypothetical protein LOK49_LG15G02114 [Camellia lanceoleosa]|uniref:Uncharacterized protein n=1 Tax=Camellia lanceoleosa TaxID=1840588 RepID=A0ACC0F5B9_9ERIC|nr:hypothetical protein LOK49_LG15G02114 [Camellia lanceoleosa]
MNWSKKRLEIARDKLEQGRSSGLFDHILVNDDLDRNSWVLMVAWFSAYHNNALFGLLRKHRKIMKLSTKIVLLLDRVVWKGCEDVRYSVKSGYFMAMDRGESEIHGLGVSWCWKKIWDLQVPAKWALFLWKLIHRILPVKSALVSRGIRVDLRCPRCLEQEESMEHFCFQCPFANIRRGSKLDLDFDFDSGQRLSVQEWIEFWFRIAPDDQAIVEAVKVLRGIWIHKNKVVFQDELEHPIQTIEWIDHLDLPSNKQLHDKLLGTNTGKSMDNASYAITNNVGWCPDCQVLLWRIKTKTEVE